MWRFLLFLGLFGSAHAADDPQEKVEAPKPEPVQPVQVWDSRSGAFVSLSEAVRRAPGRLVLDQVPAVQDRVMQADGIRVIEQRQSELHRYRVQLIRAEEAAFVARFKGL